MKKFSLSLFLAFVFVLPLAVHAGVPEAVTYLKVQPPDEWGVMGLVAAGERPDMSALPTFSGTTPNDYSKRILALTAVGQNPRTSSAGDLVAGLKSFASGGQIGDATLLNDDAWGILALRAAGVPASDSVVAGAKSFLLTHQEADGGWGFGINFGSDTNDTAAVLMALAEVGLTSSDTAVQQAVAYLQTQQVASGGFAYQLPCFWPDCDQADSASTSWVVDALTKLKLAPASWTKGANTPFTFLNTLQTDNGSWKWQAGDSSGSAAMTAYALVALSNSSYPVARYVGGGQSNRPTPLADLSLSLTRVGERSVQLKLINRGPNEASNTVVTVDLPTDATVSASWPSLGEVAGGQWVLGRLRNYDEAALLLEFSSQAGGEAHFSATAVEVDINQTDNNALFVIAVPIPTVLGEATVQPAAVNSACPLPVAAADLALANTLAGKFLAATKPGTMWYVDQVSLNIYCLSSDESVLAMLESVSLGITNANLALIPETSSGGLGTALSERLKGRILLQVEDLGEAWYVNGSGQRLYLPPELGTLELVRPWAVVLEDETLAALLGP